MNTMLLVFQLHTVDPSPSPSNCTEYDVRFDPVQGGSSNRGTVQICLNGVWGTVCYGGLPYNAQNFICAQFGFQGRGKSYVSVYFD